MRTQISENNEYYLSKHQFLEVVHFCLQYEDLLGQLESLEYPLKSQQLDGMPHAPNVGDPTYSAYMAGQKVKSKVDLIEGVAKEIAGECWEEFLKGMTVEKISYDDLNLPKGFGKNNYYKARRQYYYFVYMRK